MNIKKMHYTIPIASLLLVLAVFLGLQPVNSLTMDINPSIEIVTTRLDRVVEVKGLNEDAKELLKDFEPKDKNLENTVNDLVDLMILTGHIKGGKDNFIMITVDDDSVESKYVDKVNKAIAALLENKQIEATVLNQGITKSEKEDKMTGMEVAAQKIYKFDDNLTIEEIKDMTVRELIKYCRLNKIDIESVFRVVSKIPVEEAKKIAITEVGGGTIIEFEFDDDEYKIEIDYNDKEYEMEIDAFTGKITEFEIE